MKITNKTLRLMQWIVSLGAMIALVLVVRNFYIQRLPSVIINYVTIRTTLATTPEEKSKVYQALNRSNLILGCFFSIKIKYSNRFGIEI